MKERPSLFTVSSVIIAIAFSLALLLFMASALGIIPLYAEKQQGIENVIHYEEIGLFVALLALATSISLALPKFISKQQINTVVNDYMEHKYKADLTESIENTSCVDANISRMIAFLLMEHKYYYWAIGWSFRALKNYKLLGGDHQQLYREFHELIIRSIVVPSVQNCAHGTGVPDESTTLSTQELERIKIRAVKDYADFYYGITEKDKGEIYAKYIRTNLSAELAEIHTGMIAVCKNLLKTYYKENAANDSKRKELLKKDIMQISNYRNNCKDFARFFRANILDEVD